MIEEYPDPEEYPKLTPRYSVRKSIDKINALVGVPLNSWGQDPEIELADSKYISKLLELLTQKNFDDDDMFYTMSFLFACFEVAFAEELDVDSYWNQTVDELNKNIHLHATTLAYWSAYDPTDPDDPEENFLLTVNVRNIWDVRKHNYL